MTGSTSTESYLTLGNEPCAVEWHAIQNLCDINGLELRENKYNIPGTTGYTAILRNGQRSASMGMKYSHTLQEWVEAVQEFLEAHTYD